MERSELTKEMRWYIADRLAEDRLPEINSHLEKIIPKKTFYSEHGKRIFDIAISAAALIITAPINFFVLIGTLIDVGTPLLFHQKRLGKNGKIIHIVKFRSMKNTRDSNGELLPPAQRVTKFGKIMRKTSLDELLNFWNVFKGDMSIIGPRPLVPEYYGRYNKRHKMRMAVRPGLECPPRNNFDHVRTWQERFENDVWYVENISFLTDIKMLWRLVRFVIDRKTNNARANTSRGTFLGYSEDGVAITLNEVPQSYIDECSRHFEALAKNSGKNNG